jgi:membrane-associated protease RseP (regulator of RpoE activity)
MHSSLKVLFALLAITSASMYVVAGARHVHSSDSDFSWSDDEHALSLHSHNGSGIVVDRAKPSPLNGMQAGDVIVSIDGRAVAQIDDLMRAIRSHAQSPSTVTIRRAGHEVRVTWTYAETRAMFETVLFPPPPPPAPPAPPAPAAPPAPPAPQAPPSPVAGADA